MSVQLKASKFWKATRSHGAGRPFTLFALEDPSFFGIKALDVYREGKHWNWVYWDIAGKDHRPANTLGFGKPEQASLHAIRHLVRVAAQVTDRVEKLLRDSE